MNGAIGTVIDIVYAPGTRPPESPSCILVQFDSYQGESCLPHLDRVIPVFRRRCATQDGELPRMQFPLTLSWAMTIHKWVVSAFLKSSICLKRSSFSDPKDLRFLKLLSILGVMTLQLVSLLLLFLVYNLLPTSSSPKISHPNGSEMQKQLRRGYWKRPGWNDLQTILPVTTISWWPTLISYSPDIDFQLSLASDIAPKYLVVTPWNRATKPHHV